MGLWIVTLAQEWLCACEEKVSSRMLAQECRENHCHQFHLRPSVSEGKSLRAFSKTDAVTHTIRIASGWFCSGIELSHRRVDIRRFIRHQGLLVKSGDVAPTVPNRSLDPAFPRGKGVPDLLENSPSLERFIPSMQIAEKSGGDSPLVGGRMLRNGCRFATAQIASDIPFRKAQGTPATVLMRQLYE